MMPTWPPPGGESRVDVAKRSTPLVDELIELFPDWGVGDNPEAPVVLVAHGGVIAAMTAALLGLPVDNWPVFGGLGEHQLGAAVGTRCARRRPALAPRRVECAEDADPAVQ